MDTGAIVTVLTGLAGVTGGWVGGRRNTALASQTVDMLKTQIEALRSEVEKIPHLLDRITILEELITQRADVEAVKQIVTRIEEKIDERA